jgi:hypothetical protein
MIEQWLKTRITVAEVEAKYGWSSNQLDRWEQLKTQLPDNDELWECASPPETWRALAGREGVALVSDGKAIFAVSPALP